MIELLLRLGFSLLVVLGLMWMLARVARRPLRRRTAASGGELAVLSRQQLGRGCSVAVVQVADRALILGVTEHQVSLLGETDAPAPAQRAEPGPATHGWSQALDLLRERTARR